MENKQETVTQTEEKNEGNAVTQTENKNEEKTERTFTQKDFNDFEKKIKNQYKEKYKGYDEWLESQKTETEKQAELTQKITDTTNENTSLKQENLTLKSGVDPEDVDYIVFKVSKMEGEFEENLKDFLKDNPKYLQKEVTVEPKTTGVAVNKITTNAEDGVMAILKAKHPEAF